MRVLAIETSSPRGSVALCDGGELVASLSHAEPKAHAERILPLIERLLAEAGVAASSLDRIGVGIGPGSFTGLRVGIALGLGLGLGLDRPVVGISSLRAMARGVPRELPGPRCALVDARRGELFVAAYDAQDQELLGPQALSPASALEAAARSTGAVEPGSTVIVTGLASSELVASRPGFQAHRALDTDLPDARWVAALAGALDPTLHPPEPIYVRGAGATLPELPPSPLSG